MKTTLCSFFIAHFKFASWKLILKTTCFMRRFFEDDGLLITAQLRKLIQDRVRDALDLFWLHNGYMCTLKQWRNERFRADVFSHRYVWRRRRPVLLRQRAHVAHTNQGGFSRRVSHTSSVCARTRGNSASRDCASANVRRGRRASSARVGDDGKSTLWHMRLRRRRRRRSPSVVARERSKWLRENEKYEENATNVTTTVPMWIHTC